MSYYYPKPQTAEGDAALNAALLAECEVSTYRASGPGGQHRNKVESAVRLRHRGSGITVIAEESRLQAENKVRALKRLRLALALRVRNPVAAEGVPEAIAVCIGKDGRLKVGRRDQRYLPCASTLLDVLSAHKGSVSAAAARLGLTTGNLSSFLTNDDDLMLETNRLRAGFELKPLRRN
ncbi:MAG: peptide chain release factor-like protein [Dehalococcoidia bacterium]|nr:peptide chain release factor-like protein [Dehalococcoidia bacterium]